MRSLLPNRFGNQLALAILSRSFAMASKGLSPTSPVFKAFSLCMATGTRCGGVKESLAKPTCSELPTLQGRFLREVTTVDCATGVNNVAFVGETKVPLFIIPLEIEYNWHSLTEKEVKLPRSNLLFSTITQLVKQSS